jgi:glutathione S-transferase
MLKLCGFAASNYYNKVKFVLLEKGVPFEEELVWPSAEESFLARTPLGKIPYLETDAGVMSESEANVNYIESVHPQVPLVPRDAFARAKVHELVQFVELYIEWEARRLYGAAFFGQPPVEEIKQIVHQRLERALAALSRLTRLEAFALGSELTLADCALAVHLPVVGLATKLTYGVDMVATEPVTAYLERLARRPALQKVNADRTANLPLFAAYIRG